MLRCIGVAISYASEQDQRCFVVAAAMNLGSHARALTNQFYESILRKLQNFVVES